MTNLVSRIYPIKQELLQVTLFSIPLQNLTVSLENLKNVSCSYRLIQDNFVKLTNIFFFSFHKEQSLDFLKQYIIKTNCMSIFLFSAKQLQFKSRFFDVYFFSFFFNMKRKKKRKNNNNLDFQPPQPKCF